MTIPSERVDVFDLDKTISKELKNFQIYVITRVAMATMT